MKGLFSIIMAILIASFSLHASAMNKAELIQRIADDTGMTKEQALAATESLLENITQALVKGDQVALVGFGAFYVSPRSARTGRHPITMEPIQIKASNIPMFTAGKTFKDAVNNEEQKTLGKVNNE